MLAFGYIEQFTKITKRITAKVIIVSRCAKCTIIVNIRSFKVIELQRFTNTRNVECGIVCNKYRCVRKIFKYLSPYLWKLWSILRIFWMNPMNLDVPVGIRVSLRAYVPRFGLYVLAFLNKIDSVVTYLISFSCSCLEVYCYEI